MNENKFDKKLDFSLNLNANLSHQEKIKALLKDNDKVWRKQLPTLLNIDPRNLHREVKQLLDAGIMDKGKNGKDVYYFLAITPVEPEIVTQVQEPLTIPGMPSETFKVIPKMRKTKGDDICKYIKKKNRECSCQELRQEFNIPAHRFSEYVKRKLQKGELIRRKDGRTTFYRCSDMPLTKQESMTQLEVFVSQIPTLNEFLNYMRDVKNASNRTIELYRCNIILFYKWKDNFNTTRFTPFPCEWFTISDKDHFIKYIVDERGYSTQGKRSILIALKSYFKFLKSRNYIVRDFLEEELLPIVEEKEQPMITMDDFWHFIESVEDKHIERDLALLLLMLDTGARVGELETVCREHINFEEKYITILTEKKKRVQGRRKPRTLPISDLTLKFLKKTIEKNIDIIEPVHYREGKEIVYAGTAVFLNNYVNSRTNMKNRQIRDLMQELRNKLPTNKKITVHSFRRFLIWILKLNRMDPDYIQLRVGQVPQNKQMVDYIKMSKEYHQEYDRQYQTAHPLNQSDTIMKFNAIVGAD